MTSTPRLPDFDAVDNLADELLRALTPHAGNAEAVRETLNDYLDKHGPGMLAAVSMRAIQRTFADCLTEPHPAANAPAGALALTVPEEDTAA